MRQAINPQMQLGEIDISAITFDAKSRDDIPRLLRALQHIWTNLELRNQVFQVLATMTSTDKKEWSSRHGVLENTGVWYTPTGH